jgi:hypothetical protein
VKPSARWCALPNQRGVDNLSGMWMYERPMGSVPCQLRKDWGVLPPIGGPPEWLSTTESETLGTDIAL